MYKGGCVSNECVHVFQSALFVFLIGLVPNVCVRARLRACADKSVRARAAVNAASAFPDTLLRLFLGGYDSGGTDAERLR